MCNKVSRAVINAKIKIVLKMSNIVTILRSTTNESTYIKIFIVAHEKKFIFYYFFTSA